MDRALTLSIDWEDFGQLIARDTLEVEHPPLVDIDRQTKIILDLLEETQQKATFFVLGMLAKHRGHLVRRIAEAGHEIAIHGNNHRKLHTLSADEIRADLTEAIALVEDVSGNKVYGYRAPCFSIGKDNLDTLEILAECGLEYDSSIFPMQLPKYGIADFAPVDALYRLESGKELVELPLTTFEILGRPFPVSGGGYFRVLPQRLIESLFERISKTPGHTKMIYMHPYEFDSRAIEPASNFPPGKSLPLVRGALLHARWNLRRSSITKSIKSLLSRHSFITCKQRSDYVKSHTERPNLLERPQHAV